MVQQSAHGIGIPIGRTPICLWGGQHAAVLSVCRPTGVRMEYYHVYGSAEHTGLDCFRPILGGAIPLHGTLERNL